MRQAFLVLLFSFMGLAHAQATTDIGLLKRMLNDPQGSLQSYTPHPDLMPSGLPAVCQSRTSSHLLEVSGAQSRIAEVWLHVCAPTTPNVTTVLATFENREFNFTYPAMLYAAGFFIRACLGIASSTELQRWAGARIREIQASGSGKYRRAFGQVNVEVVGEHFVPNSGYVELYLTRTGRPGGSDWRTWCTRG